MGGLISVFSSSSNEGSSLDDSVSRPGLGDLPECCITSILTQFTPLEICKLAQLNRAFWGASSADNLWESKLPSNYMFLVERVLGEHAATSLTKKGMYARLCQHNSFDGGSKVNTFLCSTAGLLIIPGFRRSRIMDLYHLLLL